MGFFPRLELSPIYPFGFISLRGKPLTSPDTLGCFPWDPAGRNSPSGKGEGAGVGKGVSFQKNSGDSLPLQSPAWGLEMGLWPCSGQNPDFSSQNRSFTAQPGVEQPPRLGFSGSSKNGRAWLRQEGCGIKSLAADREAEKRGILRLSFSPYTEKEAAES